MKIYTKSGDKGQSSLFTGVRVPKNHSVFDSLGTIDELNAQLGLAKDHFLDIKDLPLSYLTQIEEIQCRLLDLGSHVATPRSSAKDSKLKRTEVEAGAVESLEKWIDELDTVLPPLKNFILPSGGKSASTLHVARTICRRAERSLIPLLESNDVDEAAYQYVNRLSDYLFMLARACAKAEGKEETVYKKMWEAKEDV